MTQDIYGRSPDGRGKHRRAELADQLRNGMGGLLLLMGTGLAILLLVLWKTP